MLPHENRVTLCRSNLIYMSSRGGKYTALQQYALLSKYPAGHPDVQEPYLFTLCAVVCHCYREDPYKTSPFNIGHEAG